MDKLKGEAGLIGVISGIDGRGPCQYDRAESGVMEITDNVRIGYHVVSSVSIQCG